MSTNRSKDRSSVCSFTFADGRHCRIPPAPHVIPGAARDPVSDPRVITKVDRPSELKWTHPLRCRQQYISAVPPARWPGGSL